MAEPLHITVYDPETGETTQGHIRPGEYLLLCAPPARRTALIAHANGTHQITVRGVADPLDEEFNTEVTWPALETRP